MKIAELNTNHFSQETLSKITNKEFQNIESLLWFKEGILLHIKKEYETDLSHPYDLVSVVSWVKKNKYEYVLVSKEAPVLNNLPRLSDGKTCGND